MSRAPQYPFWARLAGGCIVRSCLLVLLLAVVGPTLLFLGGAAAALGVSFWNTRAADAFRAEQPCPATGSAGSQPCYVISTGIIDALNWYAPGRSPTRRVDARLRLMDGNYTARLDPWVWDIGTLQLGEPVRARLDKGKVTEVFIGDKTLDSLESPVYVVTTARIAGLFFLAIGLAFAFAMGFGARNQWSGIIHGFWAPSSDTTDSPAEEASGWRPSATPVDFKTVGTATLLNQYTTAPPVDSTDPGRQVFSLSRNQRLYGIGVGTLFIVSGVAGEMYVQTPLVMFMAVCLVLGGTLLIWWALSWKLILSPTGFEVVGMVTRKRRRWVDVSGFTVDISTAGRGTRHVVHIQDSPSFTMGTIEEKGRLRWMLGLLGNSFVPRGMTAQDQVKVLEEWRQRYS